MAGITDAAFRKICFEKGAALSYTEMASAKALHYGGKKTFDILKIGADEGQVGIQLFGSEPECFSEAAKKLETFPNVLLDVNMGCPVTKIVRNGEGSALLKNLDLAGRIVQTLKKATKKPVTAKIRAGWDADNICAVEAAKTLEAAGADAICLHARTREQFYSGRADLCLIASVKASVNIPVIGNGDIFSRADAERMFAETGCDYAMIARGALGNPWIFDESRGEKDPVSAQERAEMFLCHAKLEVENKGERVAICEMRKHAIWYFKGLWGASAFRRSVQEIETLEGLVQETEEFVIASE